MQPKVSAIITTWNRAAMLRRAIQSVINQTYRDFELLVLDNSSTDETEITVKDFRDPRIRYICHDAHPISWARNLALREARGGYIGFLDDDDEWLPHKLQDQVAVFEADRKGKIGLVYGPFIHIDEESKKVFETIYPSERGNVYSYVVSHRDTLTGAASNPLLRKTAVLAVGGYDESIKTGEDYEMFLRLAKKYEFAVTDKPLVNVYVHGGYRLSHQLNDYLHTELVVYTKHHDFITSHPPVHALFLRVIAGKLIRLGRRKEARKYATKAFRLRPADPRNWVQLVFSFLPKSAYLALHKLAVSYEHAKGRRVRGRGMGV